MQTKDNALLRNVGILDISDGKRDPARLKLRADVRSLEETTCFGTVLTGIKTLSETTIGVIRRAKSRFPKLLERLRKRETEWTVWKGTSRAQGRCATPPTNQ
jgi:hypothetical protein